MHEPGHERQGHMGFLIADRGGRCVQKNISRPSRGGKSDHYFRCSVLLTWQASWPRERYGGARAKNPHFVDRNAPATWVRSAGPLGLQLGGLIFSRPNYATTWTMTDDKRDRDTFLVYWTCQPDNSGLVKGTFFS